MHREGISDGFGKGVGRGIGKTWLMMLKWSLEAGQTPLVCRAKVFTD